MKRITGAGKRHFVLSDFGRKGVHYGRWTSNYTFIWGMCGENQEFDDMDNLSPLKLL